MQSSTALSTLKSVKEILIEQHKMVDSLLQSTRGLVPIQINLPC